MRMPAIGPKSDILAPGFEGSSYASPPSQSLRSVAYGKSFPGSQWRDRAGFTPASPRFGSINCQNFKTDTIVVSRRLICTSVWMSSFCSFLRAYDVDEDTQAAEMGDSRSFELASTWCLSHRKRDLPLFSNFFSGHDTISVRPTRSPSAER